MYTFGSLLFWGINLLMVSRGTPVGFAFCYHPFSVVYLSLAFWGQ